MTPWRPPRRRPGLDLTPLIDVVFTLLLVVVLAARFGPSTLDVDLPRAPGPSASSDSAVEVVVSEESVLVGGREADDVAQAVVALGGRTQGVLIGADSGVNYQRVFSVLKALADAGVGVSLAYNDEN